MRNYALNKFLHKHCRYRMGIGDKRPPAGSNYHTGFISSHLRKLTNNEPIKNLKSVKWPIKSRNLNTGVKYFGAEKIKLDRAQDPNTWPDTVSALGITFLIIKKIIKQNRCQIIFQIYLKMGGLFYPPMSKLVKPHFLHFHKKLEKFEMLKE